MGEIVGPRLYSCYKCRNHVSLHDDIISKAFQAPRGRHSIVPQFDVGRCHLMQRWVFENTKGPFVLAKTSFRKRTERSVSVKGRHGRAFLFSHAMNVVLGAKEDRHLITGLHTVANISCGDCNEVLGWKYERAYEASQKYKEGKFIFEKLKIVKENW